MCRALNHTPVTRYKISKSEKGAAPDSHIALEPKEYRNATDLPEMERTDLARLYDELCGFLFSVC
jgi:hypothetical protein